MIGPVLEKWLHLRGMHICTQMGDDDDAGTIDFDLVLNSYLYAK